MRTRMLKPGFFLNEELATLDPLVRILFQGLWCIADREGRLEDRPLRIKAAALPYDDIDTDKALTQLASMGFIMRYESGGKRYIEIPSFLDHQSPHSREAAGKIPSSAKAVTSHDLGSDESQPRSPVFVSVSVPNKTPSSSDDDAFDAFWSLYPRKVGKKDAKRRWLSAVKEVEPGTILAALKAYRFDRRDGDKFIPHPATWLNQGRWDDEVPFDEPEEKVWVVDPRSGERWRA